MARRSSEAGETDSTSVTVVREQAAMEMSEPVGAQPSHEDRDGLSIEKGEQKEITDKNEIVIPDGGKQAWLNVAGCLMISFCCYGMATAFGAFQQYYEDVTLSNRTPSEISWIGSLQLCLVMLVGCISGPMFDAGYFKHMVAGGGVLYVFCLCMASIATEYYQFVLSQGLGVGLAMGILFVPSLSTMAHHFVKKRVIAIGFFQSGASIGGTVLPIMVRKLTRIVGLGWTLRILALIVAVFVTGGFFLCSTRLPPRKDARILDIRVFKDVAYSFLVIGATLAGIGLYLPVSYCVTFAIDHGIPENLAFYSLSVLNGTSIIGRLGPGLIAHWFGPVNLFFFFTFTSGITLFCWIAVSNTAGLYVYNVFFGILSGAYVACFPAATASLTKDPKEIGLRLGMVFFVSSTAWLASSPIQGALIQSGGGDNYWKAAVFCGVTTIAGASSLLVTRHLAIKRKGTKIV